MEGYKHTHRHTHTHARAHTHTHTHTHTAAANFVRGTSNLLVANMYWMIAFKIHLFYASLFEETPNRSNSEIWKSFLS